MNKSCFTCKHHIAGLCLREPPPRVRNWQPSKCWKHDYKYYEPMKGFESG